MSSTCSVESAVSLSASKGPGCGQPHSVKSTPTAETCWESDSPESRFTQTSANLMAPGTPEQLTLFAEDTPASPSARREECVGRKTRATSGRKCSVSFESVALAGSFPKTLSAMLPKDSMKSLNNWKVSVTPRGRHLFHLEPLVQKGNDSAFGSWRDEKTGRLEHFVPTPMASNLPRSKKAWEVHRSSPRLLDYVRQMTGNPKAFINPRFAEYLLGIPEDWTASGPSGTPSIPGSFSGSERP